MAFSDEQISELEEKLNKISSEIVLAQAGIDEGLIPIYSILNEVQDAAEAAGDPLAESVQVPADLLDSYLDEFKPWDEEAIACVKAFSAWWSEHFEALKAEKECPVFEFKREATEEKEEAKAEESAQEKEEEAPDVMLEISLEEDDRELLSEFQTEAFEHLEAIEQAVLALEGDPTEPESMAALFRAFHTIKGVAGFLHLVPIQGLAHEVESLLDYARNDKFTMDSAMITVVLESRDSLQALVNQVTEALETGTLPSEIVPVNHLITRVKAEVQRGLTGEGTPPPEKPEEDDTPKGFFETETAPPLEDPQNNNPRIQNAPAPEAPKPAAAAPAKPAAAAGSKSAGSTIRVNTTKLDGLMDMVGELVIVQSQLEESARSEALQNTPLQRNMSQLSRITKDLQHTSMSLRMVPIKPTFQKTSRLVRDLAKTLGKPIQLHMVGEDTELDRNVVEQIGDPLVHMIRNAIDHGLEYPDERTQNGKPATGNITLSAYHQGSNIIIELKDDGRGIDPDKILQKAIANGLADPSNKYADEEIFQFIFQPGFSTAEKITDISGRGVGMDVVKKNIEKLRGAVEVASVIGEGSTFKIILPLTMAIIDGLVVRVGSDRFILPTTSVKIALRAEEKQLSTIQGRAEVLDLRGKTVPITRLYESFNIPTEVTSLTEGILVIIESFGKPHALLVDEMISKQEVVIKNLGNMMQSLPGIAGGAILGDGTIALILDPSSLFAGQPATVALV